MTFPELVAAQLAGRTVRADVLVEFDFTTGMKRVWNGFGPLVTADAKSWQGLAGVGGISGLRQMINGVATPIDVSASGVDVDFAARVRGDRDNWYMRPMVAYLQFFDENWQTLDSPFAFVTARLRTMTAGRTAGENGPVHSVSIRAEGWFIVRKVPRFGFYTDTDQQGRSPGDRFCERTPGIEQKIVTFPDYA